MNDLWKEDPEAFSILRLQESSDPDAAHKAFQVHLKEDAKWKKQAHDDYAAVQAELARRTNDLDEMQHHAQQVEAENARLREESGTLQKRLRKTIYQRDTLLAALREAKADLEARHFDCLEVCPEAKVYAIIRAAISEVEEGS